MSRATRHREGYALGSAALASALAFALSWLCCIVPLTIFGSLGVMTAVLGAWFEPYRKLLQGLSVLALAAAFYLAYRPRKSEECSGDGGCARPRRGRKAAWIFAGAVLLLLTAPYWVGLITYWTL